MRYAKKILVTLLLVISSIMLGACNGNEEQSTNSTDSVSKSAVDIDLTDLNDIMSYTQLTEIISNPDAYLGKTVRMKGNFYPFHSSETQTTYFYIMITDNTSCCQQGLEFIWDDNAHTFPDQYPNADALIEIEGPLDYYEELGEKYLYLNVDTIKIVK